MRLLTTLVGAAALTHHSPGHDLGQNNMKWIVVLLVMQLALFSRTSQATVQVTAADIPVDPAMVNGTITYYSHFYNFVQDGHYKKWAEGFKKIYPNVTDVRIVVLPDYKKQMRALMAVGDYGDVVDILDDVSRSDYEFFYEPLNSLGMQNAARFPDQFLFNGKYYGFTYGVNVEGVVYNRVLFSKAGIDKFPRTKTELFAACRKLKALGVVPLSLNMAIGWPMQQWDLETIVFAEDGAYYAKMLKDAAPFSKDKPYGKMVMFVRELVRENCVEPALNMPALAESTADWKKSLVEMTENKVGMWFFGNWTINQILNVAIDTHSPMTSDDLGFAPLPIDDSGESKVLMDADYGVAVSSQSKNKETAKAFLYYLLNITDLPNAAGFIPGNPNVAAALPQLTEIQSYKPKVIKLVSPPAEFGNAMFVAGFDFMTGTYLRPPILANDVDEALQNLNKRWSTAIGRN
jgi:ABC-type glycerol-3-phosphate transport system substrate-binding protein